MATPPVRPAAVAGSWYPANRSVLEREIDGYLSAATDPPDGEVTAIIGPHAGLVYSGPVAAYAYRALHGREYDVAVLVGPSHLVGFDGVALVDRGAFEMPLGLVTIDEPTAAALAAGSPVVHARPDVHAREHSLEMHLPFFKRVLPETPFVPALMGYQTTDTILAFADALVTALEGRRALMIASTDLSHYLGAEAAARHDARVAEYVGRLDPAGLLGEFEQYPDHERGRFVACGGGPAISVMLAARALGATGARVLRYAHSGDVSGDRSAVVGYLAAAIGSFDPPED
jgi:AmmeMemoRadiSam system protein B